MTQGEILVGCWIDHTTARGKTYYRLRVWFDGKPKVKRTLKPEETEAVKAAIARGQQLAEIDQDIQRVTAAIKNITDLAAQYGLPLPQPSKADHDRQVKHSSASNEWYTPASYIELARTVMGAIDLDPASNPVAQEWIKAGRCFTQDDDGMQQAWAGRVWLNPPYGKRNQKQRVYGATAWILKALSEFDMGHIEQAVLLVRVSGSQGVRALEARFPRCSVGRLAFIPAEAKSEDRPGHDSLFFYLGPHLERFRSVFSKVGTVTVPQA